MTVGDDVSIGGIVYDGDNLPVSGVDVEVAASSGSIQTAKAVTDANGRVSTVLTAPSEAGEVTITAGVTANQTHTGTKNGARNDSYNGGSGDNMRGGHQQHPPATRSVTEDGSKESPKTNMSQVPT
ncbi:hypothetical protein AMQ83_07435, partial [Paenibacillus riograndensis]